MSPSASGPRVIPPRRVVFVCSTPPGHGIQSQPVLRRHLARLTHRVDVVCCHFEPPSEPPPTGVILHLMPRRCWYFPPVRRWLPRSLKINHLLRANQLTRSLKLGPDDAILCCSHAEEPVIAAALARRSGASLHLLVHDLWSEERAAVFADAFGAAASVNVVTEELSAAVAARFGVVANVFLPIGEDPIPPPLVLPGQLPFSDRLGIAGSLPDSYIREALALGPAVFALGGSPEIASARLQCAPRLPDNREALLLLQNKCRALLVFQPDNDGSYSRFSFPSKFIDFAQTGLPIILKAPPHSPLGRWALSRQWATYISGDDDIDGLTRARKLFTDSAAWHAAADATRSLASEEFSANRIQMMLEKSLGLESAPSP